jgi:hypothetical protein
MNKLERMVHDMVGNYPALRIPVVFLYQALFSAMPSKNYTVYDFLERNGFFFGFHDKQPWSSDGNKLLAHKFNTEIPLSAVENTDIEVGYFCDKGLKEYVSLDKTKAWNWQQGATLQWVGEKEALVYNDIVANRCVSKYINLVDECVSEIPHHLAAISHSGRYGLSVSFYRFGIGMPGYGYKYSEIARNNENKPRSLLLLDMETQDYKEIVSLDDVIDIDHHSSMEDAFHFFSHCQFSPDDQHFTFYHRWLHPSGHLETRMYSSDISGEKLFLFKGSDYSHIAWCNNREVLSFAKPQHGHHGYYLFAEGKESEILIGKDILVSDGHPQCSKDGRYIVTDTYPDKLRNQYLKIFDRKTGKETILVKLRIPFKYRLERRCDFHPRLSRDGKKICFDSAHSGIRSICVIDNPLKM